ncbi:hypothetical protein AN958_06926 [Leucoagaricus sp. SymC.cos]|nr:hypothetical protein AN958_06926 [Leucoagaricus sp. SymC.cos]
MEQLIGKAGKRFFEKHLEQYAPPDPLYESYMNENGQTKRRQRPLPPGLSKRDARILKSVQRRAHHLDKGFHICGFRFGWTFFIGIIPVVGDVTNMSLNYYLVIRKAKQADIPPWLVQRMMAHNLVSTGVGFVPVVGDVIAAAYKANSRNAALFEEFLRIRGEEYLKQNPPTNGQTAGNGRSGRREWTWFQRNRLSEKDVEQVKPGAGIAAGETVTTDPNASADSISMPGALNAPTTGHTTATNANGLSSSPQKSRKGLSLFGSGKKKTSLSTSSKTS